MTGRERDDRHTAQCARIALLLTLRYPGRRVIDEVQLRCRERALGRPLASATRGYTRGGLPRLHRPDLVLLPPADRPAELPVAVEVELSLKHPALLANICRAWARCRIVAGVLYIATPPVEPTLLRTVAAVGARGRVWVMPLDALAEQNRPKPLVN